MCFFASDRIWYGFGCAALLLASSGAAHAGASANRHKLVLSVWQQAVQTREEFEAQPAGTHTRAAYARVLEAFRAVYHGDPGDEHAADAVKSVAELLTEEGQELNDAVALRNAQGQYAFLRAQYPASRAARESGSTAVSTAAVSRRPRPEPPAAGLPLTEENARTVRVEGTSAVPVRRALAQVTGIRHWSTSTYTRVAIDLGGEVTFEAARVPNPDRIFFDLHGARLGPELTGRTFTVTDDGFLKRIRAAQPGADVTRVVLDVNDVTDYSAFLLPNPYRLIIDIHGAAKTQTATTGPASAAGAAPEKLEAAVVPPRDTAKASAAANTSGLPATAPTDGGEAVRPTARPVPNTVSVKSPAASAEVAEVSESPGRVDATRAPTSRPVAALVPAASAVDLGSNNVASRHRKAKPADTLPTAATPAKPADKTADGETSMIRALGLKINRIVIDAGHGGHDSGTLGVDGIEEKDVVLDVALRLGKLLHERLGTEVIYTRSDDTFIPLETRTAIANKAQADLFLSVHANSSQDDSARGVETYYLNFTSDPAALDVAARENAVGGQSIHQLSDLVKKITLKDKIAESREFASDVETSLYAGLQKGNDGLKNRGVKKAPFVVLIGANMPSVLAEISFVTNAKDAAHLREPEYRQRVAESLYAGVARYEGGLAGARAPIPVQRAAITK